ncbi:MAG TPA: pyridoxamine 5'-phosphate oxidase [candidate division Zixibacteria bacterium]|nr:pyridoxamine 5'-phosphate oxidase [candidate division Zixibacteria bacterium]
MTSTNNDPIHRFRELLSSAERLGIPLYNAAAFATTGNDGQPAVRMLLLKEVDERGFVFYTNLQSRKGRQLAENPRAAACFWWERLKRQVRIEGTAEILSDREADEYFATRPRGSQLGAWASQQSAMLASRDELLAAFAAWTEKFKGQPVPRPPYWSGYRLVPERIEFWKEQPDRLHERELYTREGGVWKMVLLAP